MSQVLLKDSDVELSWTFESLVEGYTKTFTRGFFLFVELHVLTPTWTWSQQMNTTLHHPNYNCFVNSQPISSTWQSGGTAVCIFKRLHWRCDSILITPRHQWRWEQQRKEGYFFHRNTVTSSPLALVTQHEAPSYCTEAGLHAKTRMMRHCIPNQGTLLHDAIML